MPEPSLVPTGSGKVALFSHYNLLEGVIGILDLAEGDVAKRFNGFFSG